MGEQENRDQHQPGTSGTKADSPGQGSDETPSSPASKEEAGWKEDERTGEGTGARAGEYT